MLYYAGEPDMVAPTEFAPDGPMPTLVRFNSVGEGRPLSSTRPGGRLTRAASSFSFAAKRRGLHIPVRSRGRHLFFQLVSSRYERASVIVTSNRPCGVPGRGVRGAVVTAAMGDRLVHHAEVVSLKGDSYRLEDKDLGRVPNDDAA